MRLRKLFLQHCSEDDNEHLTRENFMQIPAIKFNPLLDRICVCFGYNDTDHVSLDFRAFLKGVASFNSPGNRDQKLRTAFRLQDFDDDNVISKEDLNIYITRVAGENGIADSERDEVVKNILQECSSNEEGDTITAADFQRILAPMDFHAKLRLPL